MLKNHKYVIEKKLNMVEVLKDLEQLIVNVTAWHTYLLYRTFIQRNYTELIFREFDSINYLQHGSFYHALST